MKMHSEEFFTKHY